MHGQSLKRRQEVPIKIDGLLGFPWGFCDGLEEHTDSRWSLEKGLVYKDAGSAVRSSQAIDARKQREGTLMWGIYQLVLQTVHFRRSVLLAPWVKYGNFVFLSLSPDSIQIFFSVFLSFGGEWHSSSSFTLASHREYWHRNTLYAFKWGTSHKLCHNISPLSPIVNFSKNYSDVSQLF